MAQGGPEATELNIAKNGVAGVKHIGVISERGDVVNAGEQSFAVFDGLAALVAAEQAANRDERREYARVALAIKRESREPLILRPSAARRSRPRGLAKR